MQTDHHITMPAEIFRAYDIRGIYNQTLNAHWSKLIGLAIGSEAITRGQATLTVAYDGRLSSVELSNALIEGILACGVNVINIGLAPTPVLYFSTYHLHTGSGVMVTGSHNPTDYNGFKIMLGGHTLAGEEITALHQRIRNQELTTSTCGKLTHEDIKEAYLARITEAHAFNKPLKVVVDCGNGVAGPWITELLPRLGCEIIPLYCDIDGTFPNHHPDPEKAENLQDLITAVRNSDADIGLAFDGDGDRIGVVSNTGQIIDADQLLCLFAEDLLARHPGAEIVHDVKCSLTLRRLIQQAGGIATMWKSGHSMIKNRMRETQALFGGEFSGHIFFADQWYGFDDGLYSAVRLLELMTNAELTAEQIFNGYPTLCATPMYYLEVTEAEKFKLIEQLQQLPFPGANIYTIDGLRIEYPDGWAGIRASNTTPMLTLRFEADCLAALHRIHDEFSKQLKLAAIDLQIPELAVTNDTNIINRDN
ncbi:MAG: phosphomannomutase/phosphoglucomutase [Amphritea sp.]